VYAILPRSGLTGEGEKACPLKRAPNSPGTRTIGRWEGVVGSKLPTPHHDKGKKGRGIRGDLRGCRQHDRALADVERPLQFGSASPRKREKPQGMKEKRSGREKKRAYHVPTNIKKKRGITAPEQERRGFGADNKKEAMTGMR